jgi:hypothetical protein
MNAVKTIRQPLFSQRLHRSARLVSNRALESNTHRVSFAFNRTVLYRLQEVCGGSAVYQRGIGSKLLEDGGTITAHSCRLKDRERTSCRDGSVSDLIDGSGTILIIH